MMPDFYAFYPRHTIVRYHGRYLSVPAETKVPRPRVPSRKWLRYVGDNATYYCKSRAHDQLRSMADAAR